MSLSVSVRHQIMSAVECQPEYEDLNKLENYQNKDNYYVIGNIKFDENHKIAFIISKKDFSIKEVVYDGVNEEFLKDYQEFREPRKRW